MRDPRHILISGASSGIGEALARSYAAAGVSLSLLGRDPSRLAGVAEDCRRRGASVTTAAIDVTNRVPLAEWILTRDRVRPVDLVIANAGISAGTGRGEESVDEARAITATNVDGVINTVAPLIDPMVDRRRGQIALMASIASFRGLPRAASYCASKAFVRTWGEGLRADLALKGVEVCVICPGFVVSRMSAKNPFPMPMLMPADQAAAIIIRGLTNNRARIAFPFPIYAATRVMAALPANLVDGLLRRVRRTSR